MHSDSASSDIPSDIHSASTRERSAWCVDKVAPQSGCTVTASISIACTVNNSPCSFLHCSQGITLRRTFPWTALPLHPFRPSQPFHESSMSLSRLPSRPASHPSALPSPPNIHLLIIALKKQRPTSRGGRQGRVASETGLALSFAASSLASLASAR